MKNARQMPERKFVIADKIRLTGEKRRALKTVYFSRREIIILTTGAAYTQCSQQLNTKKTI